MDNKTLTMSLLFDFFGDLLPDKQREYFDLYYNDDLSLSEIAEIAGISRQGVRDTILKAEASLIYYEEKTGVVAKFEEMHRRISELRQEAGNLVKLAENGNVHQIALSIVAGLSELDA